MTRFTLIQAYEFDIRGRINKEQFLDVLITITNTGKFQTEVYRKSTDTDQIHNNMSNDS